MRVLLQRTEEQGGERVKIVERYAVDASEERGCDLCEEVDDLMEVEAR